MKKEIFEYNEKPFYKWRLKDDYSIEKLEPIHLYNKERRTNGRLQYRYVIGEAKFSVWSDDFDQVAHGRYFSFNDDDTAVKKAFLECFRNKQAKAQAELDECNRRLQMLIDSNNL